MDTPLKYFDEASFKFRRAFDGDLDRAAFEIILKCAVALDTLMCTTFEVDELVRLVDIYRKITKFSDERLSF